MDGLVGLVSKGVQNKLTSQMESKFNEFPEFHLKTQLSGKRESQEVTVVPQIHGKQYRKAG